MNRLNFIYGGTAELYRSVGLWGRPGITWRMHLYLYWKAIADEKVG